MRLLEGYRAARSLIERAPFDELAETPELLARLEQIFGEPLSADRAVDRIVRAVREHGDAAVRDLTARIDGQAPDNFEVPRTTLDDAWRDLSPELQRSLATAAERIRTFHERQRRTTWIELSEGGLGQIVRPLDRVGLYAPGGRAAYPSTVLMTAIPAKVAGVNEVVLTSPAGPDGLPNRLVLAACRVASVDRVFALGGAQAIAAFAFGTQSVPKVDKIFGPGNIFVILAKRRVFGLVGIDGLPGPTETVVIADGSADPAYCAADLLAQAEHDPLASAILFTDSADLARAVVTEIDRQVATLSRSEIIKQSLARSGGVGVVDHLSQAVELANEYAPEHVSLLVRDPWSWVPKIRHAGGVFVGRHSTHVIGDYVAGPSHVMPTGGTAKFASPVNLEDFQKVISLIALDDDRFAELAPDAIRIAELEGFSAHAAAMRLRLEHRPSPGKGQ